MRLMTAVLIDEHVHEKVFNDRNAPFKKDDRFVTPSTL
jgi:hypothetical protein